MSAVLEDTVERSQSTVVLSLRSLDLDALLDAATRYVRDYHPIGYGTTVTRPRFDGDLWVVNITRAASCE